MSLMHLLAVGHGNCTVIETAQGSAIIDGARKSTLLEFLDERGLKRISFIVVSHGDRDHIAGICALLADERYFVAHLYVNPDQARTSGVFEEFLIAARLAVGRGTIVHAAANSTDPGELRLHDVILEVLAPRPIEVLSGSRVGPPRRTMNSLSVVCRVVVGSQGRALLPADIDGEALRELLRGGVEVSADLLVFPHHGGLPGSASTGGFVRDLMDASSASDVVYSVGPAFPNPRKEVVDEVRDMSSSIYMACTGLSINCVARGVETRPSEVCAGTITIDLTTGNWLRPSKEEHQNFISSNVRRPICKPLSDEVPSKGRPVPSPPRVVVE